MASILVYLQDLKIIMPSLDEPISQATERNISESLLDRVLHQKDTEIYQESIDHVIRVRLNPKSGNIITSESNHINLIGDLVAEDLDYLEILDFLYLFLSANEANLRASFNNLALLNLDIRYHKREDLNYPNFLSPNSRH